MTSGPSISQTIGFLRHRVGDRIKDRYLVQELLGGGNFGSVYRVRDEAVGNVLACKEMHVLNNTATTADEREDALALFKREALSLATLRHPNIPAAYFEQENGEWHVCPRCGYDFPNQDICPDHGSKLVVITQRYYLMMDYVDGETLEDTVKQHIAEKGAPPPEEQVLEWIAQIGSAVASLHRVGIVHRDIKPDNIKIRRKDNVAMLLDFGLTKKVGEASGYGTAPMTGTTRFGTPGYAPPDPKECANPERRSDIYALGMTLYRALSGRDPQNAEDLKMMKEYSPHHFNAFISHDTERLIALSTTADLKNRYQSMDEFLRELKSIYDPSEQKWQAPPFTFADGSHARTALELARQIDQHPEESVNYLFNDMFHSWLRQNGMAAPTIAAADAVKRYANEPRHALEIFRRSLFPPDAPGITPRMEARPTRLKFPAIVSGTSTTQTLRLHNAGPGLAWGEITCLSDAKAAPKGIEFPAKFESNDAIIEVTLNAKKMPLGKGKCTLRVIWNGGELAVPIYYEVMPLGLDVAPASLDFGTISLQEKTTRQVQLRRKSTFKEGAPHGTIYAPVTLRGLHTPDRFEGNDDGTASVTLTVDATDTSVTARRYSGFVQLETNGGRWRIPVRYAISVPLEKVLSLLFFSIFIGGAGAALARFAYALINFDYATKWLVGSSGINGLTRNVAFNNIPLPLLGAGALAGLLFGTSLSVNKNISKEIPSTIREIMPVLCVLLGVPVSWLAGYILHIIFWGFGDWLLLPVSNALHLPNDPLWAWGGGGVICGAIVGIAHLLRLYGQRWARYAMWGLFSLLFLSLLLGAMIYS